MRVDPTELAPNMLCREVGARLAQLGPRWAELQTAADLLDRVTCWAAGYPDGVNGLLLGLIGAFPPQDTVTQDQAVALLDLRLQDLVKPLLAEQRAAVAMTGVGWVLTVDGLLWQARWETASDVACAAPAEVRAAGIWWVSIHQSLFAPRFLLPRRDP